MDLLVLDTLNNEIILDAVGFLLIGIYSIVCINHVSIDKLIAVEYYYCWIKRLRDVVYQNCDYSFMGVSSEGPVGQMPTFY